MTKIKSFITGKTTYLCTAVLFAVIISAIYIGFGLSPFGSKTLLTSDMRCQYIDFLSWLKRVPSSTYSFGLGTGNDTLSFIAYYLASPVNLLIFLFKDISAAASAIFIVKLFLAAMSCNLWLENTIIVPHKGILKKATPLLSLAYAFCGFTMMYSMNIIWFDTVYLFPFLILSIEKSLSDNRKSMPIAVMLIIVTGFYTGIMAIYFSVLYCLALYIISEKKINFFKMIYNYFLGISMSAVILMTTLIRLSVNKMSADNFLYKFALSLNRDVADIFKLVCLAWIVVLVIALALNIIAKLSGFKPKFITSLRLNKTLFIILGSAVVIFNVILLIISFRRSAFNDLKYFFPFVNNKDAPQLYSGIVTYIGIVLGILTAKKDISKKYIILLGLLVISALPLFSGKLDVLLHSGQEPISFPFRYTYIITFFLIAASAYGFASFEVKDTSKALYASLGCVLVIEIFANSLGSFRYNEIHWFGYTEKNAFDSFVEKTGDAVSKINDDGFYRVEKHFNRNVNDAMQLGYNGISHYSSMYNHEMIDFLRRIGCICTIHYGTYIGHTTLTDSLFGIKYTLGSKNTEFLDQCTSSPNDCFSYYDDAYQKIYSNDTVDLYQNPKGSNLAFYTDKDILNTQLTDDPQIESFDNLNSVFNSIVGYEENPYKKQQLVGTDTNTFKSTLTSDGRVFIRSKAGVEHTVVYVNGTLVGSGYYGMFGYVNPNIYCGTFSAGDELTLKLESSGSISPDDISLYVEEISSYDKITDYMSQHKADYTFISDSKIVFNVSGSDNVIFTGIPFDKNWKVISESGASVTRIYNTFLGIEVPDGTYTVTLKYVPDGLAQSAAISILALLAYIVYIKKNRVEKRV